MSCLLSERVAAMVVRAKPPPGRGLERYRTGARAGGNGGWSGWGAGEVVGDGGGCD